MIEIDGKIVSTDLLTECFACDITACKGQCCIDGDAGAPLTLEEVDILEAEYENYKPYMTAEGTGNAKMCDWNLEHKKEVFPITRGNGNKYLNYYAIEKYMTPAVEVENKVFEQAYPIINKIREGKATAADLKPVYEIVEKVF